MAGNLHSSGQIVPSEICKNFHIPRKENACFQKHPSLPFVHICRQVRIGSNVDAVCPARFVCLTTQAMGKKTIAAIYAPSQRLDSSSSRRTTACLLLLPPPPPECQHTWCALLHRVWGEHDDSNAGVASAPGFHFSLHNNLPSSSSSAWGYNIASAFTHRPWGRTQWQQCWR